MHATNTNAAGIIESVNKNEFDPRIRNTQFTVGGRLGGTLHCIEIQADICFLYITQSNAILPPSPTKN